MHVWARVFRIALWGALIVNGSACGDDNNGNQDTRDGGSDANGGSGAASNDGDSGSNDGPNGPDDGGGGSDSNNNGPNNGGASGAANGDEGEKRTFSLTASASSLTARGEVTLTVTGDELDGITSVVFMRDGKELSQVGSGSELSRVTTLTANHNGEREFTARVAYEGGESVTNAVKVSVDIPCLECRLASCTESPTPICLEPTLLLGSISAIESDSLTDQALTDGAAFNTDTGAILLGSTPLRAANVAPDTFQVTAGIGFARLPQAVGEPALGVWFFRSLEFGAGTSTFAGSASVALAAHGDLTVPQTSLLDVGGKGIVAGPGGSLGGVINMNGEGCGPGVGAIHDQDTGAGGGGFGGAGGDGSSHPGSGGPATACESYADLRKALRGGSGGGGGDKSIGTDRLGGGGGGALLLYASGKLTVEGRISAGGGGAIATGSGNSRPGSGGGSGGAVLLEAAEIALGAQAGLYANGGGGSAGSQQTGKACTAGSDGSPSLTPALGGTCADSAWTGGAGAAAANAATSGAPQGGAGGGLGRIVFRSLHSALPALPASGQWSPSADHPAFKREAAPAEP